MTRSALLTIVLALGCAVAWPQTRADQSTPEECSGTWFVRVRNELNEQADVYHLDVTMEWRWLGYVSAGATKTYEIPSDNTLWKGKPPRLRVTYQGGEWQNDPWNRTLDSPIEVTLSCEA